MREVLNGIAGEAHMEKEVSRKKSRFFHVACVKIFPFCGITRSRA